MREDPGRDAGGCVSDDNGEVILTKRKREEKKDK